MENNKAEDNKDESCEKHSWCKHHHVVPFLAGIILLIAVFGAGMAVGHEGRHERGYRDGGRGWSNGGGCGMNRDFSEGSSCGGGCNFANEPVESQEGGLKNFFFGKKGKTQVESLDATNTKQNLTASSSNTK